MTDGGKGMRIHRGGVGTIGLRLGGVLIAVIALFGGGCGDTSGLAVDTGAAASTPSCDVVARPVVEALGEGLRAGWSLGSVAAVRARDPELESLYYMSGSVTEEGGEPLIATWATTSLNSVLYGPHNEQDGKEVAERIRGRRPWEVPDLALIWSVDEVAQSASVWRGARHARLAYLGTSMDSPDAIDSRACVSQVRDPR